MLLAHDVSHWKAMALKHRAAGRGAAASLFRLCRRARPTQALVALAHGMAVDLSPSASHGIPVTCRDLGRRAPLPYAHGKHISREELHACACGRLACILPPIRRRSGRCSAARAPFGAPLGAPRALPLGHRSGTARALLGICSGAAQSTCRNAPGTSRIGTTSGNGTMMQTHRQCPLSDLSGVVGRSEGRRLQRALLGIEAPSRSTPGTASFAARTARRASPTTRPACRSARASSGARRGAPARRRAAARAASSHGPACTRRPAARSPPKPPRTHSRVSKAYLKIERGLSGSLPRRRVPMHRARLPGGAQQ